MGKKKRGGAAKELPPEASTSQEHIDPGVLASALAVEYPLIDPSLIHAMLLDYEPASLGKHVDEIRDQLGILEATSVPDTDEPAGARSPDLVDEVNTSERASPIPLSAFGSSLKSSVLGTTMTSSTSSSSVTSEDEPQTEQELLGGFFPSLPQKCILDALACEPSLEAAVEHLLSIELIRGVQRTGAWPDEPEEDNEGTYKVMFKSRRSSLGSGSAHSGSAHTRPVKPVRPPKKAATLTIPLVDTLQRRAPPVRRAGTVSGSATPRLPGGPSTDVWSAFASLAAYLSDTLPRAPATFFTSFLHSPDYMCAHEAVLAALSNLASTAHIDAVPEDAVEIIEDVFGVSLADEGSHDLELCTRAAEGDVGAVMDLMDLLTELMWWPDYEAAVELRRDPFDQLAELHRALPKKTAKAPTPAPATSSPEPHSFLPTRAINANRLQRPKSEEPQKRDRVVPGSRPAAGGYTSATPSNLQQSGRWAATGPKGAPISWKTVAKDRPRPTRGMHPLAASIPAYARGQLPQDQRPGTLAAAQRESGTAAACYEQSDAEWARRAAAMRAAAQHFRAGGQRHVGASVAGHYAAQARAAGDAAREWELRAARIVVDAQMDASGHTVDLHYATADQAATLALEAAERWWNAREGERLRSAGAGAGTPRPLIVVTGKGTHSAGKCGVLGPSVAKALADEGWRVERFEGYVAVKGRR